jgi:hypothetical protein
LRKNIEKPSGKLYVIRNSVLDIKKATRFYKKSLLASYHLESMSLQNKQTPIFKEYDSKTSEKLVSE